MDDIEKTLKKLAMKYVEELPPREFTSTIKNTLDNKKRKYKWKYKMKKIATIAAVIMLLFITSVSVYASLGGTIFGKPAFEWIKIKFPDEYKKYIVEENQNLSNGETKLTLVSKVCDDGIVVLEFDLTLSDEDEKHLKLDNGMISYKDGKSSIKKVMPKISFNNKLKVERDITTVEGLNNFNLIIDDKEYWIRPRTSQTATEISENKYKIYEMYFLKEKELEDKTNFTIELKDVAICGWGNICIDMKSDFKIELSKDKALENTKTIIPSCNPVTFKKMTKRVDKVILTPLQTIVKITSIVNDVSLCSLESTRNKNYIGINEYKAHNQDGTKLSCCRYETKRTVIYEDGSVEEWEQGDIGTSKEFENAQMILTEYVIIEKNLETSRILLTPTIRQPESRY